VDQLTQKCKRYERSIAELQAHGGAGDKPALGVASQPRSYAAAAGQAGGSKGTAAGAHALPPTVHASGVDKENEGAGGAGRVTRSRAR
jgi:hypothetical protein